MRYVVGIVRMFCCRRPRLWRNRFAFSGTYCFLWLKMNEKQMKARKKFFFCVCVSPYPHPISICGQRKKREVSPKCTKRMLRITARYTAAVVALPLVQSRHQTTVPRQDASSQAPSQPLAPQQQPHSHWRQQPHSLWSQQPHSHWRQQLHSLWRQPHSRMLCSLMWVPNATTACSNAMISQRLTENN